MKWNDLKIGKKIAVSMGTLLLILCVTSTVFILSLRALSLENKELQDVESMVTIMLLRESDHLKWINALQRYTYDEQQQDVAIQENHTLCNLGKWLYGQPRKEAEELFPEIKEPVKAMEAPHAVLHESVAVVRKFKSEGAPEKAEDYFEKTTTPNMERVQANLLAVSNLMAKEKAASTARFNQAASKAMTTAVVSAVLGVIAALGMTLLISRSITRPVVQLADYASVVASGEYGRELSLKRGDELGHLATSLGHMVSNMVNALQTADQRATEAAEHSSKAEEAMREAE